MRCVPSVLLLAATALGQATWVQQFVAPAPSPREGHNLVFDPASQRTFLFWGRDNLLSVTPQFHMWDGAAWSPAAATFSPPPYILFHGLGGICSDGAGAMLMFGGYAPGFGIGGGTPQVFDQTWRVQGSASGTLQFTLLSPAVRPPARQVPGMVLTNQGVVLFGGAQAQIGSTFGDTWRWNGTTWTNLAPTVSPPARSRHAMAFDPLRNVVVLFGGAGFASVTNDTWEFDGAAWQQRFPAQSPPPRCHAAFCWSPALGRCVLAGGGDAGGGNTIGDCWTWDGTHWQPVLPLGAAPFARQAAALAEEPGSQRLLLFGGRGAFGELGDTWRLELPPAPPTFAAFGAGCAGPTAQVPMLAAAAGSAPRLGSTSPLVVANLPIALTLPVFVLGLSNTYEPSPGYALPIDLAFVGWPGCQQLVSHDVFDAIPTLTGTAARPFAVPLDPLLVGVTFHAQVLVLYQPGGVAVSNGLTGTAGF